MNTSATVDGRLDGLMERLTNHRFADSLTTRIMNANLMQHAAQIATSLSLFRNDSEAPVSSQTEML